MCIFGQPDPEPMGTPPPVQPRVETDDSKLPESKTVIDPDETSDVQVGSNTRTSTGVQGATTGTNALRINLNQPGPGSSTTGGLNV